MKYNPFYDNPFSILMAILYSMSWVIFSISPIDIYQQIAGGVQSVLVLLVPSIVVKVFIATFEFSDLDSAAKLDASYGNYAALLSIIMLMFYLAHPAMYTSTLGDIIDVLKPLVVTVVTVCAVVELLKYRKKAQCG